MSLSKCVGTEIALGIGGWMLHWALRRPGDSQDTRDSGQCDVPGPGVANTCTVTRGLKEDLGFRV